jgi:hypothetical protein
MLIFFIIVILFLLLLIIFSGATPAQSTRTRPRLYQPNVPVALPPEPKTQPPGQPPSFTPAKPQALNDFFVPVPSREVEQPFQFSEAEIRKLFNRPPVFEGQGESFDWDAPHRATGQTHRVCSCQECQSLRARHGIS